MTNLAEEARYLHDSLFSRPLDEKVVERYVAANRKLFPDATIGRIVEQRLDVEAVEFALRRKASHADSQNQILCYLVEVRADYQADFVAACREAGLKLLWKISGAAWKRLKGGEARSSLWIALTPSSSAPVQGRQYLRLMD